MEAIKICADCGKQYTDDSKRRTKYCEQCRSERNQRKNEARKSTRHYKKRQQEAEEKKAANGVKSIGEISKLARAAGMTYGQYVAKYGEVEK